MLDPVLERRLVRKGKSWVVQLADKEVDFCDTFKLFCTTRWGGGRGITLEGGGGAVKGGWGWERGGGGASQSSRLRSMGCKGPQHCFFQVGSSNGGSIAVAHGEHLWPGLCWHRKVHATRPSS